MRLKDRAALITGGTSGIGEATSLLFAREGASVAVVGRNIERGDAVADRIRGEGGNAIFVQADVRKGDECQHAVELTMQAFGRLDVLFNNAGTYVANDTDRLFGGGMGRPGRHQPEGHVPDVEVRPAAHDRGGLGLDHQLLVGLGARRWCEGRRLLCREGRDGRDDQGDGDRPRAPGHPGERGVPGRYRHADGARGRARAGHVVGRLRAIHRERPTDRADGDARPRSHGRCCSSRATSPPTSRARRCRSTEAVSPTDRSRDFETIEVSTPLEAAARLVGTPAETAAIGEGSCVDRRLQLLSSRSSPSG